MGVEKGCSPEYHPKIDPVQCEFGTIRYEKKRLDRFHGKEEAVFWLGGCELSEETATRATESPLEWCAIHRSSGPEK
jgi:hypothetical protein